MIQSKMLNVTKVKLNPKNPRTFNKNEIEKMVISIVCFPEMLDGLRSITIKDNIVLGGNLRLKALRTILETPTDELITIIKNKSQDKTDNRINFLIDYWNNFKDNKEFNFIIADNLTGEQANEFLIRDNVNIGAWDFELLSNDWNADIITEWGVDVWPSEEENGEKIETVEKEIKPFNEVHILLSFHPNLFDNIKQYIEKIQQIEGVYYAQSAN